MDYVADVFVGPRSTPSRPGRHREAQATPGSPPILAIPARSGCSSRLHHPKARHRNTCPWPCSGGRTRLARAASRSPQSYVLASFLSRVCSLLTVDAIRDWNLDQPDTWGAVGHFAIAARTQIALSTRFPKLVGLMDANRLIIAHDDDTILNSDFKGMGEAAFVPMADVPDFFWKHGKQGASRGSEGPNHFADMDQPRPGDGMTLLKLCEARRIHRPGHLEPVLRQRDRRTDRQSRGGTSRVTAVPSLADFR